jgi:hypothetical protein
VDKSLSSILKQAKAQVMATEQLLHWNRKTLDDAETLVEIVRDEARATKEFARACKRLRFIRSNHKRAKSQRPN